jgi:hypothetical protein
MDVKGIEQRKRLDAIFAPLHAKGRYVTVRELSNRARAYQNPPDLLAHFALCQHYDLVYHMRSFSRHHYCKLKETPDSRCPYPYLNCPCERIGQLALVESYQSGVIEG